MYVCRGTAALVQVAAGHRPINWQELYEGAFLRSCMPRGSRIHHTPTATVAVRPRRIGSKRRIVTMPSKFAVLVGVVLATMAGLFAFLIQTV